MQAPQQIQINNIENRGTQTDDEHELRFPRSTQTQISIGCLTNLIRGADQDICTECRRKPEIVATGIAIAKANSKNVARQADFEKTENNDKLSEAAAPVADAYAQVDILKPNLNSFSYHMYGIRKNLLFPNIISAALVFASAGMHSNVKLSAGVQNVRYYQELLLMFEW